MPKNVKTTTFFNPLDLIAPHSCRGCGKIGTILCERCKNYILERNFYNKCPNCKAPLPPSPSSAAHICPHCTNLPPFYTIGTRTGLLAVLIHDYKYSSVRAATKPLASLMASRLSADLSSSTHIVPLPTSTAHIRARGFDHIALIARRLSRELHFTYSPILDRAKNTVQVGADKSTRLSQAASAYALRPSTKIAQDAVYVLLDDVWTTGASMLAATSLLRSAGIKNIHIALLSISDNA